MTNSNRLRGATISSGESEALATVPPPPPLLLASDSQSYCSLLCAKVTGIFSPILIFCLITEVLGQELSYICVYDTKMDAQSCLSLDKGGLGETGVKYLAGWVEKKQIPALRLEAS